MKKLFSIVATTVILILLSIYTRNFVVPFFTSIKNNILPAQTTETISTTDKKNCVCSSECICADNETDCDCSQTKSICSCTKENGEVITVESIETNNEDIEEINPEETSHEDETIVAD